MGGFLFDCFFKNRWSLLKFLYLIRRCFKLLAGILTDGSIWLTATYSAASFHWPLNYAADIDDWLLYYKGAIFQRFFFMTFRHIFSGEFWLTAILYSGQWRLAAILKANSKLKILISRRIWNRIQKYSRTWIRGTSGFDSCKKPEVKNLMLLSL